MMTVLTGTWLVNSRKGFTRKKAVETIIASIAYLLQIARSVISGRIPVRKTGTKDHIRSIDEETDPEGGFGWQI